MTTFDPTELAREIAASIEVVEAAEGRRRLIAVAGPPASGKTTIVGSLVDILSGTGNSAASVPMDGFHLDDKVLETRGLLARKGAPETFDAEGFLHAMRRLKDGGEVILPAFDRKLEMSIAGRIVVPKDCDTVIVEGNYLLLDEAPWRDLARLWDFSFFLSVGEAELNRRLMERWRRYGYDEDGARSKAQGNDLPNARRISASAERANLVLTFD